VHDAISASKGLINVLQISLKTGFAEARHVKPKYKYEGVKSVGGAELRLVEQRHNLAAYLIAFIRLAGCHYSFTPSPGPTLSAADGAGGIKPLVR
jgi:hypothetical protein